MIHTKRLIIAAIATSFSSTLIAAVTLTPTPSYSETLTFINGLSDAELDVMFGKSRPRRIGPHPILYLTEDQAKQIKGKNPMAIAVIRGGFGAAVGGGSAYMAGGSARQIAVGAAAGFAGGFFGSFGSTAAGGGYSGAFAGGLAGGYGAMGTGMGCSNCHQDRK